MTDTVRKPLGGKAYGSIPHLPGSRRGPADYGCHEGQARIATERTRDRHDVVIVQEKLDGSCVSVAKMPPQRDGEGPCIVVLTRAGYYAHTSPFEQHHRFQEWAFTPGVAARFHALLEVGERVCGEWLIQAHGTRYSLPHEPFVPFDIFRDGERVPFVEFHRRVTDHGFTAPYLLHRDATPFTVADMMAAIASSGHGAIDPVEGAVWRVERRGKVDFLCKFVRHDKADGIYLPELNGGVPVWNSYPEVATP